MVGTGYVGLVSGVCFSDLGNDVICVDKDENKINNLKKGIIPIYEPGLEELVLKNYNNKKLKFSTDLKNSIKKSDIIFICVGTPTKKNSNGADLTQIYSVSKEVSKYINKFKDKKIFYFNLGSTQDVRSAIIGNTYFKDGTYFEESAFVTALKTPNTIILLDEISRANPEAWNILMPVLDANIRKLRLDEKENSPVIDVADGVSFISTANIGFEYTSARMLDRALVDRFSIVEMDTLDKEQEMKLLAMKYSKLNPQVNEALCDISFRIRMECERENSKLSSMLSTRTLIEAAEMSIDDFSIDEIAELIFYPQYPEDGGTDSERIYVRQLVQKYIQKGTKENLFTDDDFRALDNYDV